MSFQQQNSPVESKIISRRNSFILEEDYQGSPETKNGGWTSPGQLVGFSKIQKIKSKKKNQNQSLNEVIESMKMLEKFEIKNEEESVNRFKLKKNEILQKIDLTNKKYLKSTGLPTRSAV